MAATTETKVTIASIPKTTPVLAVDGSLATIKDVTDIFDIWALLNILAAVIEEYGKESDDGKCWYLSLPEEKLVEAQRNPLVGISTDFLAKMVTIARAKPRNFEPVDTPTATVQSRSEIKRQAILHGEPIRPVACPTCDSSGEYCVNGCHNKR
jgi:hypothetical protein